MKEIILTLAIVLGIFAVSILPPVDAQICDEGFFLFDGQCLLLSCPSGFVPVGDMCVFREPATSCGNNDTSCIEEALREIELAKSDPPFSNTMFVFFVTETEFQGTDERNATFDSASWLEWRMNFQDGTEKGTTQIIRTSFSEFQAFDPTPLFAFVSTKDPLRTLINAEVIGFTNFSQIGTDFCFDSPRWNLVQEIIVNGKSFEIAKQLFPNVGLDPFTQIHEGTGIGFSPELVERLLGFQGFQFKSGDQVVWKITANNRYTLWKGEVQGDPNNVKDRCGVTGELAFDGFHVGMVTQLFFTWADPFELISRPTTTAPDLDGDGIPDSIDQCDFSPETFNTFEDEDGCPDEDPIGFIRTTDDRDGDGIPDSIDFCPDEAEIFNGIDDTDGCPDGATLPTDFPSFGVTGEELESLTQEAPELVPLPSITDVITPEEIQPTPIEEIELLEDNPMTEFHTDTLPTGNTGQTSFCNIIIQNCDLIISQAVRDFERGTGIMLPFEPTIFNIIIILGTVVAVILIVFRRKKLGL